MTSRATSLGVTEVPVRAVDSDARDRDHPPEPTELSIKRLQDRFAVRGQREEHRLRTYLDTSDRRLAEADLLLWVERPGRRLVLERAGARVEQESVGVAWPARLDVVPDGPVRQAIAKPVGVRALLPYVEVRVSTTTYLVLNDDGKTVARLQRSRGRPAKGADPWPDRIEVEHLRGYDAEANWVEKRLRLPKPPAGGGWSEVIRGIPVPGQPDVRSARMTAAEPADVAVAGALLDNLAQMEAAVDGIRRDLDIEYLHDFRVAVRRTRSILKLLGDVLPEDMSERAAPELRWLGQVTTPGRDLDVYVEELPELARDLVRPADLDEFARHVRAKRAKAYGTLRQTLGSTRFGTFREQWRAALESAVALPQPDGLTAGALADERLHRTFRKVARRAKAINPASESAEIHDLRKACKELRYLLEMFRPLCDPPTFKAVTADFKGLQDVLGEFQDGEVQAAALREFAEEMLQERSASASTLLSMGELAAQFDERQRAARGKLLDHHMTHLGRSVARHIDHVVASRGAR